MSTANERAMESFYSKLMKVPPEIRNTIYQYAFSFPQKLKLRSPSHRRLRPSRIRRDDTRGFLDSCHSIREEAVSVYYGMNPLVFRTPEEAIEFVQDIQVHPTIRTSIRHIAVDFGDTVPGAKTLEKHFSILDQLLIHLPAITAIETRFYVRKSDNASNLEFILAVHFMRKAAGSMIPVSCSDSADDETSNSSNSSPEISKVLPTKSLSSLSMLSKAASRAMKEGGFKITIFETTEEYPRDQDNSDTLLCCNVCITNDPKIEFALGTAGDAVKDRLKRVGVLPLKLFELRECPEIEQMRTRRGFLNC